MENDEVDIDFKLKQFLSDVHKFSERRKQKQKEIIEDPQISNMDQGNPCRFENITCSNLSSKGILEQTNKARLTGDLESLLHHGGKELEISSEEESTEENCISFDKKHTNNGENITSDKEAECRTQVPCKSKASFELKGNLFQEISNLIKFSEKRAQDCMTELEAKANAIPENSKNDAMLSFHNRLMNLLHKRMMERALLDEDGLLENFKTVCHEYMLSKKANLIDKCVQTENDLFEKSSNNKFVKPENPINFDFFNKKPEACFNFIPREQSEHKNSTFGKKENSIETPQVFKTKGLPAIVKNVGKPYIPIILSPLSPGRKYASISPGAFSPPPYHRKGNLKHFSVIENLQKTEVEDHFLQPLKEHSYVDFNHTSPPHLQAQISSDPHCIGASEQKTLHQACQPFVLEENQFHYNNFISTSRKRLSNSFNDFNDTKNLIEMTSSAHDKLSCPKRTKLMFSPHRL